MSVCEICRSETDEFFDITVEKDWSYLLGYKVCEGCKKEEESK